MNISEREEHFEQILTEHGTVIRKVCRMFARGAEEGKDLFQEIALQLWRAYPTFRQESSVRTWIYRVALNVAISGLRKKDRSRPLATMHHEASAGDHIELLYQAIDLLSSIEKGIVLLYLEGFQYGEIAELMGITENHVGVKMHRIKGKLREIFKKNDTL